MSGRVQMLCLWCGPIGVVLFVVAFWLAAGLIPPPSPDDSAAEIVAMYREDTDLKRLGLGLTMVGGALMAPWTAVITVQMRRIEGHHSPLAYIQLGLGMLLVLLFIFPVMVMQVAAFRPDRDPELVLLLNDLAWLPFVGIFTPAVVQNIAIALCALRDREQTVFGRWVAYFNVWAALAFLPAFLIPFFKEGPFAWDGVFCFWVPLTVFGLWFAVMFVAVRGAIRRQVEAV